jgi:hypothetical protein
MARTGLREIPRRDRGRPRRCFLLGRFGADAKAEIDNPKSDYTTENAEPDSSHPVATHDSHFLYLTIDVPHKKSKEIERAFLKQVLFLEIAGFSPNTRAICNRRIRCDVSEL